MPKTRTRFWTQKLLGNVARDRRNINKLSALGWHVLVVWECELADEARLQDRLVSSLETNAD